VDRNASIYEFGTHDDKLLVVINIKNKLFYYEGDKQIYLDLKSMVTEFDQQFLPNEAILKAVFTTTIAMDKSVYMAYVVFKLTPTIDLDDLNAVLKRNAWMKLKEAKTEYDPAMSLVDTQGVCYRFHYKTENEPTDHVNVYQTCNSDTATVTYAIPDQVINDLQALVIPLFTTEAPTKAFINTTFVRAYVGMMHYFETRDMLKEYGYMFTPDQKETFNKIDLSKWIKLTFPVIDEGIYEFALYDSAYNSYFFSSSTLGANVKVVSKLNPKDIDYYLAPGMDVQTVFEQLVSWYEPKGVLSEITTVRFSEVYTKTDDTDYVLVATLTTAQSTELIDVLDYATWKQQVGVEPRGITYPIQLVTTTGLHYYLGFETIIELTDGSYRHYNLSNETWDDLYNYVQSLK